MKGIERQYHTGIKQDDTRGVPEPFQRPELICWESEVGSRAVNQYKIFG